MSSVIEIDSSDDEAVDVDPAPVDDDEVIILSGEVESRNNNQTNIDLTNDTALNNFIEDILETYKDTSFTREFLQLLKLSYDLESSDGMKRVIVKNLIPAYTKADPTYTSSNRFKIFILNSIYKLNTSPDYKFSHLKDLCDVLKSKFLVKVTKLIKENRTVHTIKRNKQPKPDFPSKKQKLDVIDLDDEVINIDTVEDFNHNEEKENSKIRKTAILEQNTVTYEQRSVTYEQNIVTYDQTIATYEQKSVTCEQNTTFLKDLLDGVPTRTIQPVDRRIKELEDVIKSRKESIEMLEQQEVDWDDDCSAYIKVDGLKQELVLLYKQLCKLRGENFTQKTKQIRLYPADGRHPGPSEKLQLWLNSQTEENGMPRFPDLFDVVKCVEEACKEYGLNWEKQEVLQEARLLFTQCGKALQRRRQKREWKELLRAASDDPAEHDAELQARLEHNRKVARAREDAVLTHYSKMDEIRIKRCRTQRRNSDNTSTPESTANIETSPPYVLCYPPESLEDTPSISTSSKTENVLPDPKEMPSTSNPGNSFQGTFVSHIHKSDYKNQAAAEKEIPKAVNETKSQEQNQQVVQVNILNYATLRELGLNNYVESQMDNENNTNLELDRLGNVDSEDQDDVENLANINSVDLDAVKTEPVVKQESSSSTNTANENMDNDMLIEQDIPIENGYDGSNIVKINSEDVKLEPEPEFDAIEKTETEFIPEINSCEDSTASNESLMDAGVDTNSQNEKVSNDNSRNDGQEKNACADDSLLNNTHSNTEGVTKIKTESIKKEDETLKLMLEFDGEFSDTVITTVFDIEEPVVFIEISSSEDESESEELDEEEDLIQLGEEPL